MGLYELGNPGICILTVLNKCVDSHYDPVELPPPLVRGWGALVGQCPNFSRFFCDGAPNLKSHAHLHGGSHAGGGAVTIL